MNCKQVVELVTEYLEGTLSDRDRRRFEEHLEGCAGCREYLAQVRAATRVLRAMQAGAIPPAVEAELMKAFRDFKRSETPEPPSPPAGGV